MFHNLSQLTEDAFLFESTEGDGRLARFSMVGIDPALTISLKNGWAEIREREGTTSKCENVNPVQLLQDQLNNFVNKKLGGAEKLAQFLADPAVKRLELPFVGGLVGYLGYGAVSDLEKVPRQTVDPFNVPDWALWTLRLSRYFRSAVSSRQFCVSPWSRARS